MIVISSSLIRLNRERYAYLGRTLMNTGCKAAPDNTCNSIPTWGIQGCEAHTLEFDHYPFNEFIYLLQGTVDITTGDGRIERFNRGDCFIIPRDLQCTWTNADNVRKLYVVCNDNAVKNRFRLERIISECHRRIVERPRLVTKSC